MIPYGVLFVFCQILAEIRAKLFLEKPITYRPAESLRCLPMKSNFLLEIPPESGSARLGHIPSLPGKPQLPLKPCISLQPFYFKRQLRFLRFSLRFQCVLINTSVKEGSLPSLTNHLRRAEPARPQFAFGGYASAK